MTHVIEMDPAAFALQVESGANEKPVLVDFSAEHRCGPCRAIAPVLAQFAEDHGDKIDVVKVDVDNARDIALKYGIRGIPTLKLFRHGEPVDSRVGTLSYQGLKQFVSQTVSLDP